MSDFIVRISPDDYKQHYISGAVIDFTMLILLSFMASTWTWPCPIQLPVSYLENRPRVLEELEKLEMAAMIESAPPPPQFLLLIHAPIHVLISGAMDAIPCDYSRLSKWGEARIWLLIGAMNRRGGRGRKINIYVIKYIYFGLILEFYVKRLQQTSHIKPKDWCLSPSLK
jgi:hypothetical protein